MIALPQKMLDYIPNSFADLLINDPDSAKRLKGILEGRPPFPVPGRNGILLHGVGGTGKTALMKVLPDWMEQSGKLPSCPTTGLFHGKRSDYVTFIECGISIKAAERLLEIQNSRKNDLAHSPSGWRWVCFDEVDALSPSAIFSLKSIMSASLSTIFLFTSNNPQRLNKEFRDRCMLIEMNQMNELAAYLPVAKKLLSEQGFAGDHLSDAQIIQLAASCNGSLRAFRTDVLTVAYDQAGTV